MLKQLNYGNIGANNYQHMSTKDTKPKVTVHGLLENKSQWYKKWHNNANSAIYHWALVIVASIIALVFINQSLSVPDYFNQNSPIFGIAKENEYFNLSRLTNAVLIKTRALAKAPASMKAARLTELNAVIEQRKQVILTSLETDPKSVAAVVVTENATKNLPQQAVAALEKRITLEGQFVTEVDDFINEDTSKTNHVLKLNSGQRVKLYFADEPQVVSNSRIRVTGYQFDSTTMLVDSPTSVQTLQPSVLGVGTVLDKKVAVFLVTFRNYTTSNISEAQARDVMFTSNSSVNKLYQESSFGEWGLVGHTRVDGDVFSIHLPNNDNTGCSSYASHWRSAVDSIAASRGIVLSNYNNHVYYFNASDCSWAGHAGLNASYSYIKSGYFTTLVVGHELGHNYGFKHANTYTCSEGPVQGSCSTAEYRDPYDMMGNRSPRHTNVYNKTRHWLDTTNIENVTASGTYTLAPMEKPTTGKQILKIAKDDFYSYYVEFRQPFGFDGFASTDPAVNGLLVRIAPTKFSSSYVTNLINLGTGFALPVGQTFTDNTKGVSVKNVSVSATGATVNVSIFSAPCVRANPTVTISPFAQWSNAGTSVTYNISLKNNNSATCAPASYEVTPTLPSLSWIQSPISFNSAVASGASVTRAISVTSPIGSLEGLYQIQQTAVDVEDLSHSTTAPMNYNVTLADVAPPVVTISSPASGSRLPTRGKLNVTVTATDESGISSITIYIDNKAAKTCTSVNSCSYDWGMNNKVTAGSHTIRVLAKDKAPTANAAEVSIQVIK